MLGMSLWFILNRWWPLLWHCWLGDRKSIWP